MASSAFLPFARPEIDDATIDAVSQVLRSGWITTGPKAAQFEKALSEFFGGRIVKVFTSATAALELALLAAGIGEGDEVITTAMSFAATSNVILRVGAKPVFVDAELHSRNIDLDQVEAAITPRTRALMPVHFAGLPVDMDRLYAIARKHELRVIEDAAHAIGAQWRGRRIGSFGDLVAFSFHPNKNMTTIEGGALVLDNADEAQNVDLNRFHGIRKNAQGDLDIELAGGKSNFSDVSAAVGLAQLNRVEAFNARRRELAMRYLDELSTDPPMLMPQAAEGHCWHMFAPLLPLNQLDMTRHEFIRQMHARGIGVGVHYPAIHTLSLYRRLGYAEKSFPNAERIGRETVTLPLFSSMTDADVTRVCSAAKDIIASAKRK